MRYPISSQTSHTSPVIGWVEKVSRCVWIAVTSIVDASSSVRTLTYDPTVKSEAAEFTPRAVIWVPRSRCRPC